MNRDPDLRVRQRTSPIPAGTECSIGSAVSSGGEGKSGDARSLRGRCISRMEFLRSRTRVGASGARSERFSLLHVVACGKWNGEVRGEKTISAQRRKNPSPGT